MRSSPGLVAKICKALFSQWGTLTMICLAATTLYYMYAQNRPPKLEAYIADTQSLTDIQQISRFRASFFYGDRQVNDLRIARIQIRHVRGRTLVGEGGLKNILHERVTIRVTSGYEILSVEAEAAPAGFLTALDNSTNAISLGFSQWRPGESATLKLFVEKAASTANPFGISIDGRPIINGDISIIPAPSTNAKFLRGDKLATLALALLSIILPIYMRILFEIRSSIKEKAQLKLWKDKYSDKVSGALFEVCSNKNMAEHFARNPDLVPKRMWERIKIPPPPEAVSILNVFPYMLVIALTVCALAAIGGLLFAYLY